MLRKLPLNTLLITQLPSLVPAFVIAELFFKWKSFALECLGFLATWFVIDLVVSTIRDVWTKRASSHSEGGQGHA